MKGELTLLLVTISIATVVTLIIYQLTAAIIRFIKLKVGKTDGFCRRTSKK